MTIMNDDIIITVEDGGFLTIDEKNGKVLCRQILEINVSKRQFHDTWIATVYPIHDKNGRMHFEFSTMEKANGFLDIMYQACIDLDKMNSGVKTDTIVKTRIYKYG
jgi:predicted phosphoadenosine phosphosulfate sulfurtransferase